MTEAYTGETFTANSVLDIEALRKTRALSGMTNVLSRQPLEVYAAGYQGRTISPLNTFVADGHVRVPDRAFFVQRQTAAIARLKAQGLI